MQTEFLIYIPALIIGEILGILTMCICLIIADYFITKSN